MGRRKLVLGSLAVVSCLAAPLFLKGTYSSRFLPHAYCYLWDPRLLTLHLVSDSLIFFAYVAIASTLWYLLYKGRRKIPFHWTFAIFGVFILACGLTHLMDVVTLWKPLYWLAGYIKVITAIASVATAITLPRLIPKVISETASADALKQSQKRVQALLDSAPDAMVIANADSTITLVNSRAEEAFGYSKAQLLGRKFETLLADRFRKEHPDYDQSLFTDPGSPKMRMGIELSGVRRNGEEFPIEISLAPMHTEEGPLVTGTIRDITYRKRAENKFRGLLEAASDAIVVVDKLGKIALMNSRLCEMFGYSREEMLGQQVEMLVPESFRAPYQDQRAELFTNPRVHPMGAGRELYGLRKNGTEFPIAISLGPLETEDGILISSAIRDITHEKEARQKSAALELKLIEQTKLLDARQKLGQSEEALQQSERRYHALFDENPQNMFVYDAETLHFLDVNEASLQQYGYSREEFLGRALKDIIPPEDLPRFLNIIGQRPAGTALQKEAGAWKHAMKSGEIIDMSIVVHKIDFAGSPGVLCVVQDIREKRRSQEQMQEAQKLEAIGQLAGGVSHDFNNLLGVIMGQAELLNDKLVDESLRGRATSIIQAADRGASLAHQLLAFSRKQAIQPSVLSLNGLVTETVRLLGRTLGEEIELVTGLATDLWLVSADPGQMQQVLLNLALNARDAMPHGGKLTIETANVDQSGVHTRRAVDLSVGDQVLLTVTDTGQGMTDHVREKIFEPFFTTKPAGKGTGLGLSMVYGIVKQNDGHIWVSSELTKGTVFKIYLPRSFAQSSKGRVAIVPAWGSETVLVVEDQAALRETLVDALKDYGYTVLQAANGLEALEVVARENGAVQLVITDVIMPEMSGTKLARCLKAIQPATKLLFMSGYTGDEVQRQGGLDKTVAFVQKPFSPSALVGRVRQVLDGHEASIVLSGAHSAKP